MPISCQDAPIVPTIATKLQHENFHDIVFGRVFPCFAWVSTKVDGGWEQSKACLENFPFNNAVAQQTLDTVIDTLDAFFVFKDIAARPPKSQLSIKNVDLIKELKALKNKKYNSDFAFQTDIQNIASSLYDAHLSYSPLYV
ncbi:hypothetical protein BC938DRAFT_481212 [Jimgerdemannia flammicorona]|uniref:Uncharacterized protein n=1 Tax=Jimgerdemannia flammicorona TaxID=994334 RepID=A0A433QGP6_9FUNG|nr:hypothetical protein BC938DRAFT_481212 [Jimgerdemannia flammicorona]